MSLHRKPKTQQAFLLEAMQRMDMDPDQFARRLGASRRRLDDWLKRTGEPGSVELDPVIWTFVRELVERAELAEARDAGAFALQLTRSLGGLTVRPRAASTASGAVSDRRTRAPRLMARAPMPRTSVSSPGLNPPSGPL
jgi:hypothetical protein